MIKRNNSTTFIDRLFCDKCQPVQEMVYETILFSGPPKFQHTCPKCGYALVLADKFPRLVAVEDFKEWI